MRILFWSDNFYPGIGGVEVLGAALLLALRERGHEFVVVGGPFLPGADDPTSFHNIPVYRFPFEYLIHPSGPEMVARTKHRLNELKQTFRPDLVHMFQTLTGFVFHLETQKASPAPTLLSLHGNLLDAPPQVNTARRRLLSQVDAVTACSHDIHTELLTHMPELASKTLTVTNALPLPALAPTPLDFQAPVIACPGRLHPQKGFDFAIRAFAKIHSRFPRARLVLAGDGQERAALLALVAQWGLQDRVVLRGWVSPPQIPAFLNESTLVLMPSRWEPFGLVALQAAQMGRPIIASRVGGLPEIVLDNETGLLIEPGDVDGIADALACLLDNPGRAIELGHAAYAHARSNFAWDSFVDAYEAMYFKLAPGAHG